MTTSTRTRKIAKFAAVPVGLLTSGALILGFSSAAFTAQTTNEGNNWAAGSVSLTDEYSNKFRIFDAKNLDGALMPGEATAWKYIAVDYVGTEKANVKLAVALPAGTGDIAKYIDLTITNGYKTFYTGTLADLAAMPGGVDTLWQTKGTGSGESMTFNFHAKLAANTPDSISGQTIGATTFTWSV